MICLGGDSAEGRRDGKLVQRIKQSDLENQLRYLRDEQPDRDYSYARDSGTCGLMSNGGSREVSPRGSKRETYEWIQAFRAGWWAARREIDNG